jgi:chromosome segregation ATPase
MTDAELIKMLRSSANRVVNYAADRIEDLTATMMTTSMKTTTTTMTGSATKSGGMTMTDDLAKRLREFDPNWDTWEVVEEAADRIEALTAERDKARYAYDAAVDVGKAIVAELDSGKAESERDEAYASGYSDAETEISKSALGQRVAFLNAEYSNAAARIKDLNELLNEAQTEWSNYSSAWMTAEGKLADAEDFIEHLLTLLTEAASDLTAYVDAEYPPDTCAQYPHIANRHYRDMELVRRIEVALKRETP